MATATDFRSSDLSGNADITALIGFPMRDSVLSLNRDPGKISNFQSNT
jgi:hypothetical protein